MRWRLASLRRPEAVLFAAGCALYLATRVVGLTRFPIYFFCDEAVQSTLADGLLHNGLRSDDGVWLPPYLRNDQRYNLSLSVYLQIPGVALAGTSVLATRLTSVVVGSLAVVAMAVIAKVGFGARTWWISPLVLAAIPAWFLHSRTAFEVVMMVAFYAWFIAAYVLYRYRSPRYLLLAVAFGAATFYSYANGQGVMLVTGLLLVISDHEYHRRALRSVRARIAASAALVVCAAPYLRERSLHPAAFSDHLRGLDSYWYRDLSLPTKVWTYLRTYAQALDPRYWFGTHNDVDMSRHIMKGMGHVWWPLLPFVAVGLVVCLRNWRSSAHRLVLITIVAVPFSPALSGIQVTRVLAMVVPIAVLCGLGIEHCVRWVGRTDMARVFTAVVTVGLAALSLGTLRQVLTDGPTWYTDYGLYYMQWGAPQVMGEVDRRLAADPALHVVLSPNWANNANVFVPFFVAPDARDRVTVSGIGTYLDSRVDFDPATLFVLPVVDYEAAVASGKFDLPQPDLVIDWPDGRPGFYFTHLRYLDE